MTPSQVRRLQETAHAGRRGRVYEGRHATVLQAIEAAGYIDLRYALVTRFRRGSDTPHGKSWQITAIITELGHRELPALLEDAEKSLKRSGL